ncbi:MAG: putative Acyl carrier protein [Actinomycetia bacterium]|nr:putative Acyl carrier protein [Actinomycetes bacterium]
MALHERLQDVFRDVFNNPGLVVDGTTTSADIPEWDSLQHVTLLFRIEDEFGVEFLGDEAASLGNVGELESLLTQKGCG